MVRTANPLLRGRDQERGAHSPDPLKRDLAYLLFLEELLGSEWVERWARERGKLDALREWRKVARGASSVAKDRREKAPACSPASAAGGLEGEGAAPKEPPAHQVQEGDNHPLVLALFKKISNADRAYGIHDPDGGGRTEHHEPYRRPHIRLPHLGFRYI